MTATARYARSSDARIRLLGFEYFGNNETDEVHFRVKGTTSNYDVVWIFDGEKKFYRCSCPDHTNRGSRCKHIYFCFSRVLRLDPNRLDDSSIEEIIQSIARYVGKRRNLTNQESLGRRPVEPDDECPICFEKMAGEDNMWCVHSCKNNVHRNCMTAYAASTCHAEVRCPLCRAPWELNQ